MDIALAYRHEFEAVDSNATQAVNDSSEAKTNASTALVAAQAATADASTAKRDASVARGDAVIARDKAEGAEATATTARDVARTAQTDASVARSFVAAARADARQAKDDAAAARAGAEAGVIGFDTLAALEADLAHPAGTIAWVTNDPTATNNGTYRKVGASGSGSWVRASYDRVDALEANLTGVGDIKVSSVEYVRALPPVGSRVDGRRYVILGTPDEPPFFGMQWAHLWVADTLADTMGDGDPLGPGVAWTDIIGGLALEYADSPLSPPVFAASSPFYNGRAAVMIEENGSGVRVINGTVQVPQPFTVVMVAHCHDVTPGEFLRHVFRKVYDPGHSAYFLRIGHGAAGEEIGRRMPTAGTVSLIMAVNGDQTTFRGFQRTADLTINDTEAPFPPQPRIGSGVFSGAVSYFGVIPKRLNEAELTRLEVALASYYDIEI